MNKNVIIVGASSGIGLELTRHFSCLKGYRILALSRNCSDLEREFAKQAHVSVHRFDLAADVHSQLGKIPFPTDGIDYLINNAGFLIKKPFELISNEEFSQSFAINAIGVMQTVQYLLPFLNAKFSHIVNISSMGAFQGSLKFPELSAYAASKAAICNFTEVFAAEYADSTIKMNCLCLGAVNTKMLKEAFPNYEAKVTASEMAHYIADFTLNRGYLVNGKIVPVSLSTP